MRVYNIIVIDAEVNLYRRRPFTIHTDMHDRFANLLQSHLNVNSNPLLPQFGSFLNYQWVLEHKVKEQLPLFLNKKQTIAMFTLYNNMHMSVDVSKFC